MIESLNIPLNENPIPQKFWGIVVFVAPLLGIAFGVLVFVRLFLQIDTLTAFMPKDADTSVRIVRTPQTQAVLEDRFHGTLLFSHAPWTVDELGSWAKRGSIIFLSQNTVVGVAADGNVPDSVKRDAENLGFTVVERAGGTYIGSSAPQSTHFSLRLPFSNVFPGANGELFRHETHEHARLKLTKDSLTILGAGRSATIPKEDGEILANITVSAQEANEFLGFDIPLTFPGLNTLQGQMFAHGFAFTLFKDSRGTGYLVSIAEGILPKEDLESVVTELYRILHISVQETTNVYASIDELVSTSTEEPVTVSDPQATISTISNSSGDIVRAAQTAHGLILTNRPVNIDSLANGKQNTCLAHASSWVKIQALTSLLPTPITVQATSLKTAVLHADTVAFTKHRTRVCWGQIGDK